MKSERRRHLLKILHQGDLATQHDFVEALRAAGHEVTQATVSRDLQALGAVKVRIGDEVAYRFPDALRAALVPEKNLQQELTELAIDIRCAGSLVVIVTLPGHAGAIARAVDLARADGVVGSIAGDDTVFVATPDESTAHRLADHWLSWQPSNGNGVA